MGVLITVYDFTPMVYTFSMCENTQCFLEAVLNTHYLNNDIIITK